MLLFTVAVEAKVTSPEAASFPVHVSVDAAARPVGPLKPLWRFFGADEPNYAYMKDGERLLGELGGLVPDRTYFRTHNLLTTGDGTPALKWGSTNAYTEGAGGRAVYDWTILDRIFDAYRRNGVRPYVEIGFMPEALSAHPVPYRHHWTPHAKYGGIYTGWAYPPRDYAKWSELVFQWASHDVRRYGEREVARWYFETWNEPNIGYWQGGEEEFFKLHDVSTAAVRRALPAAKVGGPDSAGGGTPFLRDFLAHCRDAHTPLDFISFHAKGAPKFVDNHVRMGLANQLRDVDSAFSIVASFPEYRSTPVVIGEWDPDGCAACQGPQLAYRNSTLYSSFTAASLTRLYELADRHGVNLEGALTWAFEFEDQPYFAGFRVLSTNGIDLPVLNAFRLFSKMGGDRVPVVSDAQLAVDAILKSGVRAEPDVSALASVAPGQLAILLTHYHDDDLPGPDAAVEVSVAHLPSADVRVEEFTVDAAHANAFAAWQEMGSPQQPSTAQIAVLKRAAEVRPKSAPYAAHLSADGSLPLRLTLPRQAVTLVVLRWGP